MHSRQNNPFFIKLSEQIQSLGGVFNAHLHLDRVYTLDDQYMVSSQHRILQNSHISLHKKHSLITSLHEGPAYEPEDFKRRVNLCLDGMVATNTFRADTMVDVTADRVGLSALHMMREIKQARASEIDLQLAAYSPLGFKDDEPERWELFKEGVALADFIGCLPEADDADDYPDHIGFMEHCRRMLELAKEHGKALHVHTDQRNEPSEDGTERLVEAVRQYGAPKSDNGEPMVWAVHMISPSTYDEARFDALVDGLLECNIGVICCPSAAVGMRQIRPLMTPTYNSIPRVLEMAERGVHIRLASDNIADICSPSTTEDLLDEVFVLSAAIRFYDTEILAKLAHGAPLDDASRAVIRAHLQKNQGETDKLLKKLAARA